MYDPEIYEDILKIRERYFLCLEEDGMLGKLPQDWEIIIITREKDHGPYVATCSYKECLQFLCHRIASEFSV